MRELAKEYSARVEAHDIKTIETKLKSLDLALGQELPGLDYARLNKILREQKLARQRLNRLKGAQKAASKRKP